MHIGDARFVAATTFRSTGEPVSTPVWIAHLGDARVGIVTDGSSGKVARLRADPRITLTPCDARGNVEPGALTVNGVADVVTGTAFEDVRTQIARKYSWQFRAVSLFSALAGLVGRGNDNDTAIVVTLDSHDV